MSDIYEPATRAQTPTTKPQTAKTADAPKTKGRVKANEEFLEAGPDALLDGVPKGRTAQIEEAIATTMRDDEGMGPTLKVWNEGIGKMAKTYGENRDEVAGYYITYSAFDPGSSVGKALKSQRTAELAADYSAYTTLAMEAQNIAILSGPTLSVVELADKSHSELMMALTTAGYADAAGVDGARVQAESRFHLEAEKDEYIPSRGGAMSEVAEHLGDDHRRITRALSGANAATATLRSRAFKASASKDQKELGRKEALMEVCALADKAIGTFGQLATVTGAVGGGGLDGRGVAAGTGLVSKLVQWIAGGDIAELRDKIQRQQALAGMEDNEAELKVIDAQLGELEDAVKSFVRRAAAARPEGGAPHRARLDGGRMDRAMRNNGALGPQREVHVPIADRLARIESAAAFNAQAGEAVSRLLDKLFSTASNAESLLLGTTSDTDLNDLRRKLPPNYFRVMIQNLMALRDELGSRAVVLEGLKVQ